MQHKRNTTRKLLIMRQRSELLALHHNRIEAWILEQAGIAFDGKEPAKLRVIGSKWRVVAYPPFFNKARGSGSS